MPLPTGVEDLVVEVLVEVLVWLEVEVEVGSEVVRYPPGRNPSR